MNILVIISSHEMSIHNYSNIQILNDYLINTTGVQTIDYCGISNTDDFHNYEEIIKFKYKIINTKKQFSKICDFISENKLEFNYDWYIKIRPDVKLLEPINFSILSNEAINARARRYKGMQQIAHGMSINGEGMWRNIGDCYYDNCEPQFVLDDMLFIFHDNVVKKGGFDKFDPNSNVALEWMQTN